MSREMLVSVFAAILSYGTNYFGSHLKRPS
jgi:hypothetical protein